MKSIPKVTIIIILFLAIAFIIQCDDNDRIFDGPRTDIYGNWEWVQSVGGFAGQTRTPETEGYTRQLYFLNNGTMYSYRDQKLFSESTFTITDEEVWGGMRKVIRVDSGMSFFYSVSNDTLYMTDLCFDCFFHTYVAR